MTERARHEPRTLFLPLLVLAAILVAGKVACLWPKPIDVGLLALTAEDMALATAFGLTAILALRLTAGRRLLHRLTWTAIAVVGALFAFHAVVNVGVYRALRQPLNVRMLKLVQNAGIWQSSLSDHSDPLVVASLFIAPALFLGALWLQPRWARARRLPWVALAVVAVWASVAMPLRAAVDPSGRFGRVVESPHRVMVESVVSELLIDPRVDMEKNFPPEYLSDFALAHERRMGALPAFTPPPKNLLIVVLESTSARYLSLYGAPYDTTPRLAAEAQHAMVFDRFYAHIGYTFCSMMPLVYSVHPGMPWAFRPGNTRAMPTALAALLKARGYRTAFLSAGDPSWAGMDYMAQAAGMDEVFGPEQLGGDATSSWGTDDKALVDGLLSWIDRDPARPFYAVAWTNQTHDPFMLATGTTPTTFVDPESLHLAGSLNRYLTALRQADEQLGRVFDGLRERHLAEDTLVVVTADHGEAFGDLHEVMGHGSSLFEESLRVPLVFWNPRLFQSQVRVNTPGAHVDLNPTLAQIFGVPIPSDWQGASLFSEDHPRRAYLQADMSSSQFGVTDDRFKYVLDVSRGFERLYDLTTDPHEQRDVSTAYPEVTRQLRARVSAQVHAQEAYVNAPTAQ